MAVRTVGSRRCLLLVEAAISSSQLVELRQLQAYTTYSVYVEACTVAGCTPSRSISLTTSTDLPLNLSAAVVVSVTSTSVQLVWSDPRLPNGPVLRSAASSALISGTCSTAHRSNRPDNWDGSVCRQAIHYTTLYIFLHQKNDNDTTNKKERKN